MELIHLIKQTGAELDLSAPENQLAQWFDDIRTFKRMLSDMESAIGDELIHRRDKAAKWTTHTQDFTIKAPSPQPTVEWDIDALRIVITDLLDEGVIDSEAADAALEVTFSYKPRLSGILALRKLDPEIAQLIDQCGTEVEKTRRASVKPRRES